MLNNLTIEQLVSELGFKFTTIVSEDSTRARGMNLAIITNIFSRMQEASNFTSANSVERSAVDKGAKRVDPWLNHCQDIRLK